MLTLSLGKDDSQKLIKNRPYRSKEELLSKAGLSKSTFDKIKAGSPSHRSNIGLRREGHACDRSMTLFFE